MTTVTAPPGTYQSAAQALWQMLRDEPEPVADFDLVIGGREESGVDLPEIYQPLNDWARVGIVKSLDRGRRWELSEEYRHLETAPDPAAYRPLPPKERPLRKNPPPPQAKPTQLQRIWSAMRILGSFDVETVVIAAEAPRQRVSELAQLLCRAGWLTRTASGWSTRGPRRWGPVAPIISRGAGRGADIVMRDQRDGTAVIVTSRGRADRAPDSSNDTASGGGVS